MLNRSLYDALCGVFGTEVKISNEDQPCSFTIASTKDFVLKHGTKGRTYAVAEDWGEVYSVCCPLCGDRRFRLFISHAMGSKTIPNGRKTPVYFSSKLCVCHNERCHISEEFDIYRGAIRSVLGEPPLIRAEAMEGQPGRIKAKPFSAFHKNIELPGKCILLDADNLPEHVARYLQQRRLDPVELSSQFHVRYAPAGAIWEEEKDGEVVRKEFFDDRLLIPIVQSRKLVSWQARLIGDKENSPKYLNYGPARKNNLLYNFDKALLYPDIVLCEGVTDVWRIGEHAMALFGKNLALPQMDMLKAVWGDTGSCVIVLDEDAGKYSDKIALLLKNAGVFPKGIAVLKLNGGDPDSYSRKDINVLIEDARMAQLGIKRKAKVTERETKNDEEGAEERPCAVLAARDRDAVGQMSAKDGRTDDFQLW